MEEKKVLSMEEIEAQTILELPDRTLMQAEVLVYIYIILEVFASAASG